MKKTSRIILGLLAVTALAAPPAAPGTQTGTLAVSGTVLPACSINTSPLNFGSFTTMGAGTPQVDSTGVVHLFCSSGLPWTLALDKGLNGSGVSPFRRMQLVGFANIINYEIYSDSTRTTIWGDGTFAAAKTGTGTGGVQDNFAYGRIPAGQGGVNGDYADSVTATVNF